MAEKKERGRFTIKLNENDPTHKAAIRLLERQPPRTKAQLVVNALVHYMNCPAAASAAPSGVGREAIEEIVREVLRGQASAGQPDSTPIGAVDSDEQSVQPQPWQEGTPKPTQTSADAQTLDLIADTLSAFRGDRA